MTGRDTARTVTVYANVRVTMTRKQARRALAKVLRVAHERTRQEPDVVGLGEWGRSRAGILASFNAYRWRRPVRGGGPLGLRKDRYEKIHCRAVKLVGWTRVEADPGNPRRHLGPSYATQVRAVDRVTGARKAWLLYHLTAGIQDGRGNYKAKSHPKRVRRHRLERAALTHRVAFLQAHGYEVTALGDSNFDGFTIPGLVSADPPPDLGSRAVSDVLAEEEAKSSSAVNDGSDHDGLVVVR